ncbi:MAG TPA: ATP-binding cassette domain-containing protein [Polyangiaceae bacterium]|nr:ATP-binding cassette domain-containing protein [Polyangiaceae bacterium]
MRRRRSWLAPEVVQSSALDCGPAALRCLLAGFGIEVSLGRLRDACQTDLDGTSIDDIEEVAKSFGLVCEQQVVPRDHLLSPKADLLPLLTVVRLPNGATHFVVVWRRYGSYLEIMDPGAGRRWLRCADFLETLYTHTLVAEAKSWQSWVTGAAAMRGVLEERLRALGVWRGKARRLLRELGATTHGLLLLDAAARFSQSLASAGALRSARQRRRLLGALLEQEQAGLRVIPDTFWSGRSIAPEETEGGAAAVEFRGAVGLAVRGKVSAPGADVTLPAAAAELLRTPRRSTRQIVLGQLRAGGKVLPALLVGAALLAGVATLLEPLLLRVTFDSAGLFETTFQRVWLLVSIVGLSALLLIFEWVLASGTARFGRQLELRLRRLFLSYLPRVELRYFASRLRSDLAERSHSMQLLRSIPEVAVRLVRATLQGALITTGLVWLNPASTGAAVISVLVCALLPLLALRLLAERELTARTHAAALGRFQWDTLLGLAPIRAHGGATAVAREHESLLVEWLKAARNLLSFSLHVEAAETLAAIGTAALLLFAFVEAGGRGGALILFAYWALALPTIGQELASAVRMFGSSRNVARRLCETIESVDDPPVDDPPLATPASAAPAVSAGVEIELNEVRVKAGGHDVLTDVDLRVPSGSHVAVVGASGAGKSTLLGLLLGLHVPSEGTLQVDGLPLDEAGLERLRDQTAWVDPGVYLWNRTLVDNICYGTSSESAHLSAAIEGSALLEALERLPSGLQTRLGEGGALVSGGEGQRVRFARALRKPGVRLALLDEPFRGLDAAQRRQLLRHARAAWEHATLLCVTHDVTETLDFDFVVCVESGRVVEVGSPRELVGNPTSHYLALLTAEEQSRREVWGSGWRRLYVSGSAVRGVES